MFAAGEQANAVYLVEATDVFRGLVYLVVNPVADHLVQLATHWPGATCLPQLLSGRPKTVKRPRGFFREDSTLPDEVILVAERPQGFEHLTQDAWAAKIGAAVRDAEETAAAERAAKKLRVLGRKAVLRASHTDRPSSFEQRRKLRPAIACRNPRRRVAELGALVRFRAAHGAARDRLAAGDHAVVFPPGTYRARLLGARCASVPPPAT